MINGKFFLVMILFLMIVILSVMIIFIGKDIYTGINLDRESNYHKRVSLSYIANKIRQNDQEDRVRIEELNGRNSVVIDETYDDESFKTWIYYYDGGLYEMFGDKDMQFNPEDGLRILDIEGFEIEQLDTNLFKLTAYSHEESTELILNIYSH